MMRMALLLGPASAAQVTKEGRKAKQMQKENKKLERL